jgi:6-phosphofructokinase 1
MNTIVEACDRICDTAAAHRRTFIIEVMGRDCGYLAMTAGIAAGADAVLVPEVGLGEAEIVDKAVRAVEAVFLRGTTRRRCLILKAEGVKMDAARLKVCLDDKVREALPDVDSRVTVLGHVVRGGAPTAFDRLLGARLANCAVRALAAGQSGIMVGWVGPGIAHPPSPWDPYVVVSPLAEALAETDRLMRGESDLARWRKRTFAEIDRVLLL